MTTHNGARWISEQLDSVLSQINVDVSIVISDDGSTDDTVIQLQKYALDSRVSITAPPTPTGSAAQNFFWLIRNTRAEEYSCVAFSDQDDLWSEAKLFRAYSALAGSDAVAYSCAVTAFWSQYREKTLSQVDRLTKSDFLFEGGGQGCTFMLTTAFYKRLREFLLMNINQTESIHYHDWATFAIARSWRLQWLFDPKPMVRYRQHENNDTGARASVSGIAKRIGLLRSGWYARQLKGIAKLCLTANPVDATIKEWNLLLALPTGTARRYRMARFCLQGGRRRRSDYIALLGAALAGWL
jgi:rhamnosyltransferase